MTQEMNSTRPWERLPNETPKAYAAFQMYLQLQPYGEMDEKRSIINVTKKLGLAAQSGVELWSAKYKWQERTIAYDSYRANSAIKIKDAALAEYQQNVVISMSNQLVVVNEILDRALNGIVTEQRAEKPSNLNDIKKLMDALEKKDNLARRIGGMPTIFTTERAEETDPEDKVYTIGG